MEDTHIFQPTCKNNKILNYYLFRGVSEIFLTVLCYTKSIYLLNRLLLMELHGTLQGLLLGPLMSVWLQRTKLRRLYDLLHPPHTIVDVIRLLIIVICQNILVSIMFLSLFLIIGLVICMFVAFFSFNMVTFLPLPRRLWDSQHLSVSNITELHYFNSFFFRFIIGHRRADYI